VLPPRHIYEVGGRQDCGPARSHLGRQASFGGNVDNQDGLPLERGKVDLLLVDIEGLQLVEALDVL
jgi:hypothetical protein